MQQPFILEITLHVGYGFKTVRQSSPGSPSRGSVTFGSIVRPWIMFSVWDLTGLLITACQPANLGFNDSFSHKFSLIKHSWHTHKDGYSGLIPETKWVKTPSALWEIVMIYRPSYASEVLPIAFSRVCVTNPVALVCLLLPPFNSWCCRNVYVPMH